MGNEVAVKQSVVVVPPADLLARFVEMEKRRTGEIKKFLEDFDLVQQEMLKVVGEDNMFQDADGVVYKVVVPDGTFVSFKRFGYQRTRRGDEKKGSLSVTEAESLGLTVKIPPAEKPVEVLPAKS